jgi:V/A-type H+-transporting ATPase subunit E
MTQAKKTALDVSVAAYDNKRKLSELQSIILAKGDSDRERILSEARAEAEKWTEEQMKQLDAMVSAIMADATKRTYEMTSRQLVEAESMRDKNRLRLQNELVNNALLLLQNALADLSKRPDYEAILTGMAAEPCERFEKGLKIRIRLRAEDASHGKPVSGALSMRFPDLDISFDPTPAPIIGGVILYSEEEKWQVVADWKSKVEEMADSVAKAVLAEL